MQNDENEDPQTDTRGVENGGSVQKKRRGGNNARSKRVTRSSRTAGSVVDGIVGENNRRGEGSANTSPTKSVLEELGGGPPDRGDGDISDDDDPVEEVWGSNGMSPSRDSSSAGEGRGGQLGSVNVEPGDVVNNGGPPSRDYPFVGGGRGHHIGNVNVGPGVVVNNGGPPSRDYPYVGSGRRDQLGIRNVRPGSVVNNGGPPSRDYPFVGGRGGGRRGTENGNVNPIQGMQVGGQRLGHGNASPVTDNRGVHGLQEWTGELQGHEDIEHGTTSLLQQERRAVSYRAAKGLTKKNIRDRIQVTLKTVIFRGVKFITCKEYFDMVMQVIIDQEKPANAPQFVRMYKTIVMGALNTKRSTCAQSAQEAAMKLLKIKNHVDEVDPPPYSMDTLCKLRQSQTAEEKEAFVWFAGELLECVCGKRAWGTRKKYRATISDATSSDTGAFIVTVSDEAFALLLYDAYIDKWIKRYHQDRNGEPRSKRIVGKYTHHTDGASNEYGGWSEEGIRRFNQLCEMVQEDRASRNARDAEEWLMNSLRQQAGGGAQMESEREIDHAALQRRLERTNQPVVNAFIEL
jgi:hypothetical protein